MTLSAVEKDSDCTPGASILPKDLGAIPLQIQVWGTEVPRRVQGQSLCGIWGETCRNWKICDNIV